MPPNIEEFANEIRQILQIAQNHYGPQNPF